MSSFVYAIPVISISSLLKERYGLIQYAPHDSRPTSYFPKSLAIKQSKQIFLSDRYGGSSTSTSTSTSSGFLVLVLVRMHTRTHRHMRMRVYTRT